MRETIGLILNDRGTLRTILSGAFAALLAACGEWHSVFGAELEQLAPLPAAE